jgi:hypothetical protein
LKARLLGFACVAALAGPASAVEFEPSIQTWLSRGKTTWNHNAQPANPALGNPTSQLTYSDMKADIIELGLTVRHREFFGSVTVGTGSIDGGTLQDEDWLAGQVKISDTNSVIKGDTLYYWMIDVGRNVFWSERSTAGVFVGFGQYYETIDAFGVTDNLNGGFRLVSASTKVISNDARWSFVRVGVNGKLSPWAPLTLSAELAYVPYVDLNNEDSHYLRNDLGPVPNIHMDGSGDGLMWQVEGRLTIFTGASLFVAYRDWRFKADGDIRFGSSGQKLPLNNFETTRSGYRFGFSYRF